MWVGLSAGNNFVRGVSGGERKRCNIGVEMMANPSLIFLVSPLVASHPVALCVKHLRPTRASGLSTLPVHAAHMLSCR